jgi:hypothetical protein
MTHTTTNMVAPAKEYAQTLYNAGFTFEEFAAEWPNLAASEYGDEVKATLEALNYKPETELSFEDELETTATLNTIEADTMNDYKLNELANTIALEALDLIKEGKADYEAEDYICETVDGCEWVIYYYKAHQVCQNCNTDSGAQWMDDCGIKGESYDDYATKLAYGEIYCRASAALGELIDEYEAEQNAA